MFFSFLNYNLFFNFKCENLLYTIQRPSAIECHISLSSSKQTKTKTNGRRMNGPVFCVRSMPNSGLMAKFFFWRYHSYILLETVSILNLITCIPFEPKLIRTDDMSVSFTWSRQKCSQIILFWWLCSGY